MASYRTLLRAGIIVAVCLSFSGALWAREPGEARTNDPFQVRGFTFPLKGGLPLGPVHLHGYLLELGTYHSNLYLTDSSTTSDFLFDTCFGLRSDLFLDKSLVQLHFDGEYVKALQTSAYDRFNYEVGAAGRFDFRDFFLHVDGTWTDVEESENVRVIGWNTVRHQSLTCNLDTGVRLGRLGIEGGGALWMRRFGSGGSQTLTLGDGSTLQLSRDYLDHIEAAGNLRLAYIWAKMRLFLSAAVGTVQYSDDVMHDYLYTTFLGGGTLDIAKKVNAEVTVGYSLQSVWGIGDYASLQDDSEYSGFVGSLSLRYFFSEKLKTSLSFVQALQFSGSSNYQVYDGLTLAVTHRLLPRLTWTAEAGVDYIDPSDNYNYTILRGSLVADYQLFSWGAFGLKADMRHRMTKIGTLEYTAFSAALMLSVFL